MDGVWKIVRHRHLRRLPSPALKAGAIAPHEIERAPELEVLRPLVLRRDGVEWVVAENLRRMVRFRRFNLLDSFGWLDDLDVVFCRNVLMYFDAVYPR